MPNLNPVELAEKIDAEHTIATQPGFTALTHVDVRVSDLPLLAAALRLAEAASDPNFPRLELGKIRSAYIEARGA